MNKLDDYVNRMFNEARHIFLALYVDENFLTCNDTSLLGKTK